MSGQTPNPKPQIPTGTMGTEPVGHGEHRLGVVALFVENRLAAAPKVNAVLSDYAAIVVGRMGIPYREKDLSVVAIIVDGTNDEIGAMTGKLGTIPGVSVKAALRKKNGSGHEDEVKSQIPKAKGQSRETAGGAEKPEARMTHCSCRGEANEETGAGT